MTPRVLRHADADELVDRVAHLLLSRLLELQGQQDTVHLCLTGGKLANQVYQCFAELVPGSELDPGALNLWWSDEAFVPTTDPERNSLQSLSILARTLRLAGSQTHPMPPRDGHADPDEAAYAYAGELGDTIFDICLLGVGVDGHVAAVFPGHESFEPTASLAVGVTDAPVPPAEQTTLTLAAINRSRRVWLWAVGEHKADAVARSIGGDQSLPASTVRGIDETLWFVDAEAASKLPQYHCQF